MALQAGYRVHNVTDCEIPTTVTIDGEEMVANVQGVEVELASEHPWDGSMKLRWSGTEAKEARDFFARDATINVSFEQNQPAPPPAPPPEPPPEQPPEQPTG